ncbi:unnamed protein product [Rangifer tarandus platyrhynchus]|uniref:Uncharacterized protein n=1 Tax=Rangifer tarandus platyrhynchus TaxID=3082113 RepID=A0ABN8ZC54_RANTA|nr:unnamed protein product [Rangifer tarandus platyrhynchus]
MILVSQGSVGSLCAAHSALSGSAWYVLFILMWIQGVTPATLTVAGVVRTTVYGPFQCGAKESCFQSLTQIPGHTVVNLFPWGNGTLSCTNLVTDLLPYPAVPSAVKSHLPLPEADLLTPVLLWEGAPHTQFRTENSLGAVGSS